MEIFKDKIVKFIDQRWHTPSTAWFFPPIVAILTLYAIYLANGNVWSNWNFFFPCAFFVLSLIIWKVTNRLPANHPDRVGVGIYLRCESDKHEKRVRDDFVAQLEQLLSGGKSNIKLLRYPRWAIVNPTDMEEARTLAERTKVHFLLFGSVREREINKKKCHVIDLRALVRHRPLAETFQKQIQSDFEKVLPKRIVVDRENEIFNFEATSALIELSAKYVIALAAFLSGDVKYAEELFLQLEKALLKFGRGDIFIKALSDLVPKRLVELYASWASYLSDIYFYRPEELILIDLDQVSKKLLNRQPRSYPALLNQAMCAFVLRRNAKEANQYIHRARNKEDYTWLYGKAFLRAYNGQLEEAIHDYMRAFELPIASLSVPIQCEEFISIVLQKEPQRTELYLCLALINLYGKNDVGAARADIEKFFERIPESCSSIVIAKAEAIRKDCNRAEAVRENSPTALL